jgi:hypothetical protein
MEIRGAKLTEGKFYLWEVATQQGTGIKLNSVYFITDAQKDVYEVVFTKPNEGNTAGGWYLVKIDEIVKEIQEGEVVETPVQEAKDAGDTLSINVEDELKLGEQIG